MSNPIIIAENISKAYQIGQIGTGTISRDLERFWHKKILKKEDPFLRIGETNDRSIKANSDIVWSLKDINFEINQGDAVGIIGKNGAGKSTLLKLLSRVTSPTNGQIKVKGRIASLLEVGTGFHPELSGRENIYLNGAILGMRKKEITKKMDEIIEFSGVERYIDTPVKRYSSGMYVRLAFAVAAHLESEILIIDEVLAVGDAEFQKKCLGKMGDISRGEGRTLLFVSHNMTAVKSLCGRAILLENGIVKFEGNSDHTIDLYTKINLSNEKYEIIHNNFSKKINIINHKVKLNNLNINHGSTIFLGDKIILEFEIEFNEIINDLTIAFDIINSNSELISHISNEDDGIVFDKTKKGTKLEIKVETDKLLFIPNLYYIHLWIGSSHIESLYSIMNFFVFYLEQGGICKRTRSLPTHSRVFLPTKWTLKN